MEFVPVAAMALLVYTLITFLRFLVNMDKNGMVTIASVWVAGVVVVFLVAQSDFADGIEISGRAMSDLNTPSLIFLGLSVASIGVFANEIRGALDNTVSTAKPHLLQHDDGTPV